MTKEQVLQDCTVEGNLIKLPDGQLERKLYIEVAKSLNLIGGKWKGGKIMAFVFQENPTDLLAEIANGEKRDLKKEFQFFATPKELANELVFESQIEPYHSILEPSAGQGAIIEAVLDLGFVFNNPIDYYELMEINKIILERKNLRTICIGNDFLLADNKIKYDRIIANPPFSKNQDIDHVMKMYDLLKDGGRLVSITSKHWQLSTNKKETAFRDWLENINYDVIEIKSGTFKESGTMIGGNIVVINKPL